MKGRAPAPRPGQNSDGSPITSPALAGPSGMSARLGPQLAGSQVAAVPGAPSAAPSPFPQIMPGMPEQVQGFPHDMGALQAAMQRGYAPGATRQEHAMAMNAASIARAQEEQALQDAFEQDQQGMEIAQLGKLISEIVRKRQGSALF